MSDQIHNYSTEWEQYLYQGFPHDHDDHTNFYNTTTNYNEVPFVSSQIVRGNNSTLLYASSSPEIANPVTSPGKQKRARRAKNSQSAHPTTFLNASITNFRALVQQHTGCHTNEHSAPKGPITLCFASSPENTHEYSNRGRF
ncbi:VQ motif-containing protein [Striga hermonthica]|uniref:VQ motif-containing protein n=1 Tax=Striga hermonthica TaxID=68872 RepID=A0A9N7RE53_STRHE|nr:VQ motif-containing protein [Striga hermonthica]